MQCFFPSTRKAYRGQRTTGVALGSYSPSINGVVNGRRELCHFERPSEGSSIAYSATSMSHFWSVLASTTWRWVHLRGGLYCAARLVGWAPMRRAEALRIGARNVA
jgi:hypothetical protein